MDLALCMTEQIGVNGAVIFMIAREQCRGWGWGGNGEPMKICSDPFYYVQLFSFSSEKNALQCISKASNMISLWFMNILFRKYFKIAEQFLVYTLYTCILYNNFYFEDFL